MTEPIYVPLLKGKEGEYAALESLSLDVKSRLMPLVEIPGIPYDYSTKKPVKTLEEHLSGVPTRLQRVFGQSPFYIDLTWLTAGDPAPDKHLSLSKLLESITDLRLRAMPVLYRDSTPEYIDIARTHITGAESGACIRLLVTDFEDHVDLETDVKQLLQASGSLRNSIDLLVDLEDLGRSVGTATLIARSIMSMVPFADEWRRLILAGASFPEDLSDVSAQSIVTLPRLEWELWKTLQKRPSTLPRRDLIFADYAMAHPIGKALDPRTMRMSANIRYTTPDSWLIVKGKNVKQYGFSQYSELCGQLVERPEYCGEHFSWGDNFIRDCADRMAGPGNATTWRKVGVNHHVTLVTKELSKRRDVA